VSVLSIDEETGGLSPVPGSPFAVGTSTCPTSVAIDASGQYLYVGAECKAELWAFAIDSDTGGLTALSGAPYSTNGSAVQGLVIQPGSTRLYASASNRMLGFTIGATGSLTPISGSPFFVGGSCLWGLAAESSGRFLYATDQCVSGVFAYVINPTTGALSSMSGSPFAAGSIYFAAVADPTGRFLYISEHNNSRIAAYGINGTTGALTPAAGSPFASGSGPWGLAISATPVVAPATLLSLEIVPANATLITTSPTGTAQFLAVGTYSDGSNRFLTTSATWTSSNLAVANISNSPTTKGRATLSAYGETTITASFGGQVAITTFTVTQPTLVSIALTPAAPTIAAGTAIQFTATGTYSNGATVKLTSGVTWTSSDAAVATVSSSGLATSVTAGTTTIGAAFGGISATAQLAVAAAIADQARFLYVMNRNSNSVGAYAVDQVNGALAEVPGSAFSSGAFARAVVAEPSGRFVFAGWEGSVNVRVFRINAITGALTVVGDFPTGGTSVYALTVDATGRLLFVANRNSHSVSVLSIDEETGGLSPVPGSPFAVGTGTCPTSLAIDASGQYLYVGVECKAELWAFAIDSDTGGLTALSGTPYGTNGSGVQGLVIQPGTARLYATSGSNRMLGYTIGATGGLTPISGSPFFVGGSCLWGLAAESSGRFLYATDQCVSGVFAYVINPTTGALSSMSGSPFATGGASFATIADPSGRFLYVSEQGNSRIAAYEINDTSGALTPATGSPFASGSGPWGLAISATPVVAPATLLSLEIVPADTTLVTTTLSGTTQFLAIGTYSDGSKRFLTTSATWTSSVPAVASISNTLTTKGRATLAGYGETIITASFGGQVATTTFTVEQATVVAIAVTPASPTIALGTAVQFTATVTYSNGTTLVPASGVSWASSDIGVATVNTSGLATSVSAGTTTITATMGGVTGHATLKVQ
jgi:6-phosphogluconolactonase (cycloisomerase 2 family)